MYALKLNFIFNYLFFLFNEATIYPSDITANVPIGKIPLDKSPVLFPSLSLPGSVLGLSLSSGFVLGLSLSSGFVFGLSLSSGFVLGLSLPVYSAFTFTVILLLLVTPESSLT